MSAPHGTKLESGLAPRIARGLSHVPVSRRTAIRTATGFALLAASVGAWRLLPPGRKVVTKPAAARDDFFADGEVIAIEFEIGPEETEALRQKPRDYVRCTLHEGGLTYQDVGVRLRGAVGSSFSPLDDKPGLTLNMDKFADGQRYRGMDKFHLANSVQDPSYLAELICGELMRAAGVPASRVGHAVVAINGRVRGLYCFKEGYDKAFLKAHFGNSHGNLYEGKRGQDVDARLEKNSGEGDVKDRADLKALAAAARERDKAERFEKLEKLLDLDKFSSFIALEAIIPHWDGYSIDPNNYRVYHDPVKDKITFIPSGMDQVFRDDDIDRPVVPEFRGMVTSGLLDTPEGRRRYIARASEIMEIVYKADELVGRLDGLAEKIQPELAKVSRRAGQGYHQHVNRRREAIRRREKSVNEQLKRLTR